MPATSRVRGTSVVFPLLLIGGGILILMDRMIPGFSPGPVIHRYWPLLLVFIGIGMVWDRVRPGSPDAPSFPIGTTLGTVLFLLLLFLMIWRGHTFARSVSNGSGNRNHHQEKVDLRGAKAVHLSVKMPAGNLRMDGGADSLLAADFNYGGRWSSPAVAYSVENGLGQLEVSQGSDDSFTVNGDNDWNLKVSDSVPLEVEVDLGAGHGEFRFAKVDLTRLEMNIGAGEADVDLSGERAKDLDAEISGGVGSATIRLPRNVGVVAEVHGGLGKVDLHGLKEEDGRYVNAAYGKSPATIHLTVDGGIGHISLQQD